MNRKHAMLAEFHLKFGHLISEEPTLLEPERQKLRVKLCFTEMLEFCHSMGVEVCLSLGADEIEEIVADQSIELTRFAAPELQDRIDYHVVGPQDTVQVVDSVCDLNYVLTGTEKEMGIDMDPCFAEVHRSNMEKSNKKDDHGKTVKPKGWVPPDLVGVLREQYPNKAAMFTKS